MNYEPLILPYYKIQVNECHYFFAFNPPLKINIAEYSKEILNFKLKKILKKKWYTVRVYCIPVGAHEIGLLTTFTESIPDSRSCSIGTAGRRSP